MRSAVAEGQLYRDLAPDMKDRDRRLRVTQVRDGRADFVVGHDLRGPADRTTHASSARLRSAAFELVEDPADADPQYLALLATLTEVHHPGATPPDYARVALNVLRRLVPAGEVQCP
ncbi:DUF6354 family protein [Streptomyces sp. NPDC031705]|uniref:DUF6354 family protein n=1 Tax=Streptomyces sp. NPDC031705 TaxID=3155729 RepID=UPI0033D64CE4